MDTSSLHKHKDIACACNVLHYHAADSAKGVTSKEEEFVPPLRSLPFFWPNFLNVHIVQLDWHRVTRSALGHALRHSSALSVHYRRKDLMHSVLQWLQVSELAAHLYSKCG